MDAVLNKSKIRKLGEGIKHQSGLLSPECLYMLEAYRVSYKDAVSYVYNRLYSFAQRVNEESIVAYRIKRIESIITKLHYRPEMMLDRMGDIAGCRCILNSEYELNKVLNLLKSNLIVTSIKDRISTPKSSGYRSLHVFIKNPEDEKIVEVQLRTKYHHNWATLVEITDLLYDERIKNGTPRTELGRLHFLLSKQEDLSDCEREEIIRILQEYEYFEKLSSVFTSNYLLVREQWLNIESAKNHSFFLIEATTQGIPKIDSYSTFVEAETEYFNRFNRNDSSNRVLTHLPRVTFKKISLAYSNYLLTYHRFVDDCLNILEQIIINAVSKNKYNDFRKYYEYYLFLSKKHIGNVRKEIEAINNAGIIDRKGKEWIREIKNEISKWNSKNMNLHIQLGRIQSNRLIPRTIFRLMQSQLLRKYKHRSPD